MTEEDWIAEAKNLFQRRDGMGDYVRNTLKHLFAKTEAPKNGRMVTNSEKRDYSILRQYATLESSAPYLWGAVSQELRLVLHKQNRDLLQKFYLRMHPEETSALDFEFERQDALVLEEEQGSPSAATATALQLQHITDRNRRRKRFLHRRARQGALFLDVAGKKTTTPAVMLSGQTSARIRSKTTESKTPRSGRRALHRQQSFHPSVKGPPDISLEDIVSPREVKQQMQHFSSKDAKTRAEKRSVKLYEGDGYTSEAREEKRKRRMDDRRRRREFRELTVTGKISRQKNEEIYKWGGRVDRRDAREGGKQKRAGFASGDDSGRPESPMLRELLGSPSLRNRNSIVPQQPAVPVMNYTTETLLSTADASSAEVWRTTRMEKELDAMDENPSCMLETSPSFYDVLDLRAGNVVIAKLEDMEVTPMYLKERQRSRKTRVPYQWRQTSTEGGEGDMDIAKKEVQPMKRMQAGQAARMWIQEDRVPRWRPALDAEEADVEVVQANQVSLLPKLRNWQLHSLNPPHPSTTTIPQGSRMSKNKGTRRSTSLPPLPRRR